MTDEKRADLAYLSGVLFIPVSSRRYDTVYDYHRQMSVSLSYNRNGNYLSIYDYSRKSYITGNLPNFYDYASSTYMSLSRLGDNYISCYDYESASYAYVRITGYSILIYDYQTGSYYNYMIQ